MKVGDVMSRKLVSVTPASTFRDVWRIFFKKKINSVPVVDKRRIIAGIITREELFGRLYPDYQGIFESAGELPDFEEMERKVSELGSLRAKDLMRTHVIFANVDTPLMRALSRMIVRRINQMPVVSDAGRLVGMVTKGDIFYALFKKAR